MRGRTNATSFARLGFGFLKRVDEQIRRRWLCEAGIAPGKLLDLAGVGPGIEALHIAVPAGVEVSMDVDLVKIPQSFGVRDIGTLFVGVMKEQMAMMPAFTSTRATSAARRRFPRLGLKRAFSNNRHFTAFEFEPLF